jgi:hypothetical protein
MKLWKNGPGDGGTPVPLAAGVSTLVAGLAVDATDVYWANYWTNRVQKVAKGGGSTVEVTLEPDRTWSVDIDATNVYWTVRGAGTGMVKKARRSPAPDGGMTVTLAANQSNPSYLAVDDTGVYWVLDRLDGGASDPAVIAKVGPDGGTPVIFASGEIWQIAADGTSVYWTTGTRGRVMKAPKEGIPPDAGSPVVLATAQGTPSAIVVDATGVYWINTTSLELMRVGLSGGMPEVLVSGQSGLGGLALDATYVYFTNPVSGEVLKVAK